MAFLSSDDESIHAKGPIFYFQPVAQSLLNQSQYTSCFCASLFLLCTTKVANNTENENRGKHQFGKTAGQLTDKLSWGSQKDREESLKNTGCKTRLSFWWI